MALVCFSSSNSIYYKMINKICPCVIQRFRYQFTSLRKGVGLYIESTKYLMKIHYFCYFTVYSEIMHIILNTKTDCSYFWTLVNFTVPSVMFFIHAIYTLSAVNYTCCCTSRTILLYILFVFIN